jgi:hypothetical protein
MKILIAILILLPSITFSQKDSTLIRDQFFLEINGSVGLLKYKEKFSSPSGKFYLEEKAMSQSIFVSFQYRNQRLKAAINSGFLLVLNPFVSFETGINLLSKSKVNKYFGPCLIYGFYPHDLGYFLGKNFLEFGFEAYFNKFHVGLKHQWFESKNDTYQDITNLCLEIGYAFNLESFRKKKK